MTGLNSIKENRGWLAPSYGARDSRLSHQVFILGCPVRLWIALPKNETRCEMDYKTQIEKSKELLERTKSAIEETKDRKEETRKIIQTYRNKDEEER